MGGREQRVSPKAIKLVPPGRAPLRHVSAGRGGFELLAHCPHAVPVPRHGADRPFGEEGKLNAYVPMDDSHTLEWQCNVNIMGKPRRGGVRHDYLPNTTGWYGRFNIDQNAANDYKIDREAQRSWKSNTGIEGIRQQDMAVTEGMVPICTREREHLGTTDVLIATGGSTPPSPAPASDSPKVCRPPQPGSLQVLTGDEGSRRVRGARHCLPLPSSRRGEFPRNAPNVGGQRHAPLRG